MNLSTDVVHKLWYGSRQREYVCIKAIIEFVYLKIKQQSQVRNEYVVTYDLGLVFDSNRLYTAPFNL